MSNITRSRPLSQVNNLISTEFQIEILDLLIRSKYRHKIIFPSHAYIADRVGCARRTVIRITNMWHQAGLVTKKKRYNSSSIYSISPIIFKYAQQLKHKVTSLNWAMGFSLLCSILPTLQQVQAKQNTLNVTSSISHYVRNIKPISYLTKERGTFVHLSSHIPKKGRKVKFKRERSMNTISISPILANLTKRLRLSKWGQIRLIPFPDVALQFALNEYQHATSIANPFNWIFSRANHYCIQHDIDPDWKLYYDLAQKHKMPKEPDYILKTTLSTSADPIVGSILRNENTEPQVDLHSIFERQRQARQEKFKDDKSFQNRVSYFQQFVPQFLDAQEEV